jgi:hypothetical protein
LAGAMSYAQGAGATGRGPDAGRSQQSLPMQQIHKEFST